MLVVDKPARPAKQYHQKKNVVNLNYDRIFSDSEIFSNTKNIL